MTYRVGLFFRMTSRSALWIDESPMNLCEILGFQPKGANALSFSSRERPAYAGMTVRGIWTMLGHRFHPHLSPLPIKGEGEDGWCCLVVARVARHPSGLRTKSAMTWWSCCVLSLNLYHLIRLITNG